VGLHFRDGAHPLRGQSHDLRSLVVGVAPHLALHPGVDRRALIGGKTVVVGLVARLAQEVPQDYRFAVQPVGGPVRRHVAAVSPHGAELLPAGGQPRLLALPDLLGGEQRLAADGLYSVWNRRSRQVDLSPEPAERRKGQHEDDPQHRPQPVRRAHFRLSV